MAAQPTAALIIIGNEILSGRTHDKNLNYLALALNEIGINLAETRVISDDERTIVETLNSLRRTYDYVFTSGGIGPTHDDITTASVAKAFGIEATLNEEACTRLEKHYDGTDQEFNDARKKMAHIPKGASLIDNPISAAPGYNIENVFVMAGVPVIFQAMFDNIKPQLEGGSPMLSETLLTNITEGTLAAAVNAIQEAHPEVEIGSYPYIKNRQLGVSLVARALEQAPITTVIEKMTKEIEKIGGKIFEN
jgi:molybdenum cofactor synthesis domain-containing protein